LITAIMALLQSRTLIHYKSIIVLQRWPRMAAVDRFSQNFAELFA